MMIGTVAQLSKYEENYCLRMRTDLNKNWLTVKLCVSSFLSGFRDGLWPFNADFIGTGLLSL